MTTENAASEAQSGEELLAAHAAAKADQQPGAKPTEGKPAATPGTEADLSIGGDATPDTPNLSADPKGPVVVEFNPTGDTGLDMALEFVGKLGIGPGNKAFDAAEKGDFGPLRAHLGALGDKAKGYENFVKLAESAYNKGKAENEVKVAKTVEAIHAVVGGAEQWKAIQKWASENAEPDEKVSVNAGLKAGGAQAKAMARYLAECYAKAKGTTVEPAEVVARDAGGASRQPAAGANGALSAKEYAVAVQAARQKLGWDFDGSKEYASLQARRRAGKRAGI